MKKETIGLNIIEEIIVYIWIYFNISRYYAFCLYIKKGFTPKAAFKQIIK